jgi:hypothetical protein
MDVVGRHLADMSSISRHFIQASTPKGCVALTLTLTNMPIITAAELLSQLDTPPQPLLTDAYKDQETASKLIKLSLPQGLLGLARWAIRQSLRHFPEFTKETVDYFYPYGYEDAKLVNEVAIAIAILDRCPEVKVSSKSGIHTADGRHHIEAWIAKQLGVDHYYLPRQVLTIAAFSSYPQPKGYIKVVDFNEQIIGYRKSSIAAVCETLTFDDVLHCGLML